MTLRVHLIVTFSWRIISKQLSRWSKISDAVIDELWIVVIISAENMYGGSSSNGLQCMHTRFEATRGWFLFRHAIFLISAELEPASAADLLNRLCAVFVLGGYWFCVCPGKHSLLELTASLKSECSHWTVTWGKRAHEATIVLRLENGGHESENW